MTLRFLPRLKPNKTWIVLGVALGIGLLAALAARSYLSNQMEAIDAKSRGQQVNVVVAKHELKRGDKLTADNVAVRPIPLDYAHSGAVQPAAFDRLDGQTLAFPVKAGEMVLWSLLEGKKAPTFSARVETGRRALTVPVDEINSISGLLEPGDIVDLLVTIDQGGRKRILTLLQNVTVMATGQRSVDDPKSGERRQYSTATLDATPEQAEMVIVAREIGKLTALLRNPQDKQSQGRSLDMATLIGLKGAAGPATSVVPREVPVLYGGSGNKLSDQVQKMSQDARLADALRASASAGPNPPQPQVAQAGARDSAGSMPRSLPSMVSSPDTSNVGVRAQ